MLSLITVLAAFAALAYGALAVWRRLPEEGRSDLERLTRDMRVRTGSYSLKLVMQRMVDEMLASVMPGLRRAYVPSRMCFGLHPNDAARWGDLFDELSDELRGMLLAEIDRRPELHLSGALRVSLHEDSTALPGRPTFSAAMGDPAPVPGPAGPSRDGRTELDPRGGVTALAAGWRLTLDDGRVLSLIDPLVVGRGGEAQLRVEGVGVSRRHARLCPLEDRVSVVDLDSSNGTWVNGRLIATALLADGDRVRFGTRVSALLERCAPVPAELGDESTRAVG